MTSSTKARTSRGVTLTPKAEQPTWYYQAEDSFANYGPLMGPFATRDSALADAREALERGNLECVDIDPDDPRDSNINIIEVVSTAKYDIENAGVKLTERK